MTPRLQELEADDKTSVSDHSFWMAEGYKFCLEDVAPVLAAAQALSRNWHKSELRKNLDDALAEFKGE